MKIKAMESNREEIKAAIDVAQGRAKARTIRAWDVLEASRYIEMWADTYVPKVHQPGIRVHVDPWFQKVSASYAKKGKMLSTQFILERGSEHWFLVDVVRGQVKKTWFKWEGLESEDRKEAIFRKLVRKMSYG